MKRRILQLSASLSCREVATPVSATTRAAANCDPRGGIPVLRTAGLISGTPRAGSGQRVYAALEHGAESPFCVRVRGLVSKSKGDLNKKKVRRGPQTTAGDDTWFPPSDDSKTSDSSDYYETLFASSKGRTVQASTTSFSGLGVQQPGEDDAWSLSPTDASLTAVLSKDSHLHSELKSRSKGRVGRLKEYLRDNLLESEASEVVLPETLGATPTTVESTCEDLGLHWRKYGTKGAEIMLISKYPLARYRPEFDPRTKKQHDLKLDTEIVDVVRLTLNTIGMNRYQDDWVEHPDDMKAADLDAENVSNGNRGEVTSARAMGSLDRDAESSDADEYSTPGGESEVSLYRPVAYHPLTEADTARLRQRYEFFMATESGKKMIKQRQSLPTWERKGQLLDLIRDNQVVILSGETGCGKTTQLPQFILEDAIESGAIGATNIVCTQPRRISAMSVSRRVADERGEILGDLIGYQIRMAAERSPNTRLLFCTSGVLLRKLIYDRGLENISHVIVDEIHERGMNEDFLLIILRNLLKRRPELKLILMSATLNAEAFSEYFSNAPTLHVPGFMYPVKEHFMEDVLDQTGYVISASDRHRDRKLQWYQKAKSLTENPAMLNYIPKKSDFIGYKESTFSSIRTWASCSNEKVHYGLIEATVEHICRHEAPGGILVFLTSWENILTMTEVLEANPVVGNVTSVKILPLHSTLASVSQEEIFKTPPPGVRKVVLATNIAETSITINDIVYVVNTGKAKEKSYDALNKIACLFPTWISKASCTQRKGRAGRVQAGHVYHLFPRSMHAECFMEHQLPEIMRTPLAELCLQIKSLGLGSMQEFMAEAMNPPSPQTVTNAILQLKSIGAIDKQQELTPLGRHLAQIPVEPSIGKMILMGAIFGCLDPCLTIAAASTVKDPFQRPIAYRKVVDAIKINLAAGTCSDHIALLRAFEGYREAKNQGTDVRWSYCRENFFIMQSFDQIDKTRLHFAELLANIGFLNVKQGRHRHYLRSPSGRYNLLALENAIYEHSGNSATLELLRAVLCSGMFPSVAAVFNESKKPSFLTLEDGTVRPHMLSVNNTARFFPHRWLVYTEKVQTGGILFRNSTMVTDLAVLLFGGDVEIDPTDPANFSILDGRFHFKSDPEVTQVIVALKSELQSLLEKKVREPQIDIFEHGGSIVGAVMTLLSNETAPNKQKQNLSVYEEALEGSDIMSSLL